MNDALSFVRALPDPVIVIGPDGRVEALNDPAIAMLGTDATGWPYVTALRQPVIVDAVGRCLGQGETLNVRYIGRDGARDTHWDVSVMRAGASVVLSFRDTTALSDADEKRRDFVANVSHELRTPLTSLVGFIETLRGPAKDDPAARDRFLGIMEQEAGRMHRLVEDLLSLSRVEDLERIRPTTPVDLVALVRNGLAALAPVAAQNNVTLVAQVPADAVEVLGDAGQMAQVLRNLVENAIKYGGTAGNVTVRVSAGDSSETTLAVIDEGEGIASHHIARLTERFFRVDSHRGRDAGGTGLGLAICKHIITRHRARLRIISERGQGSEFSVIFPSRD